MNNLENEIRKLIQLKKEGGYWDFKREWYSKNNGKNADMLHDIICMANNLEDHDGYIIIGVDEENGFQINDITNDENRKNTQNLVDFLRGKKFAGGFKPSVRVETMSFEFRLGDTDISETKVIDVIVIKNDYHVPYYLNEDYYGVFHNNIYVRHEDSNTPKNESADFVDIEYLWKKRFHLYDSPIEKVKEYLKNISGWEEIKGGIDEIGWYYKHAPEYKITLELTDGTAMETYMLNQLDKHPSWGELRIKYHNTVLYNCGYVNLDGGRYQTNTPLFRVVEIGDFRNQISYNCFIKGKLPYLLHKMMGTICYTDRGCIRRFEEVVLYFSSEKEMDEFEVYLINNFDKFENIYESINREKYKKRRLGDYDPKLEYAMKKDFALKAFQEDYKINNSSLGI